MPADSEILTAADDLSDGDLWLPAPEARHATLLAVLHEARVDLKRARRRLAQLRAAAEAGRHEAGREERRAARQAVQDALDTIQSCRGVMDGAAAQLDKMGRKG